MSSNAVVSFGRNISFIIFGPAVAGLCVGLRFGLDASLAHALSFPAILIGVALFMIPALYIGAALAGIAPNARAVVASMGSALRASSLIYLGLAPSLAFLIATSEERSTIVVLAFGVLTLGVLLGLRDLYAKLFGGSEAHARAVPLFAAWSLVSMGIGGSLLFSALAG